jgi:hypothetical protein
VASTEKKTDLGSATNWIRSVVSISQQENPISSQRKGNIDDMIDVISLAVTAVQKLPSIAANDPR